MKLTNKYDLPVAMVHAIESLQYDPRDRDPKRIGITTLISNPLPRMLTLKYYDQIQEDISDHIWRIAGSGMHEVLSRADKNKKSAQNFIEEKLEQKVGDWTVVGKLDHYDSSELTVSDYKITSIWSVRFGEHTEWEQQLNPYAWLLRRCGFEVNKLQICALLKDWRKGERAKDPRSYPPIPFQVIPVKLWPLHKQEAFIQERLDVYANALKVAVEDLEVCSPKERWAKEDVYAVVKNANKTSSRNLATLEEAQAWAADNIKGKDTFRIDKRPGEDLRCQEYCSVNKFCKYYQETYMK